jgi:eukaryotic-like serine/threonine-protein kinase
MPGQELTESTVVASEETRLQRIISSGATIGQYTIISKIGEGGMGEVYRARDKKLGRDVAIKVLPASFAADADRLDRFRQEARAAGKLNHPNILVVYHVGKHAGAPYMVSEFLKGKTLRERIDRGSLPQRKAIDYAFQIAKGLAAAHEKGIIHRDIKPENIFVTNDGRVKILDFGLAKRERRIETTQATTELFTQVQTDAGTLMGTVGYMSPDQVKGEPVSHQSDIFSFGSVFYEMLSGRRAFRGKSAAETMSAILREDPPDLSETNKNISPALEGCVRHCLEKNPAERFQSARDLAFSIESIAGISGVSRPELVFVRPPAARRLWPILLGLLVFTVSLALVAGALVDKSAGKMAAPSYRRLTFSRGTTWNARFTPDGQTFFYSARWNGNPLDIFAIRTGRYESRSLNLGQTDLLAISATNEMAILRNAQYQHHFVSRGTLARMPVGGGAPRDLVEDVQEADWSPVGDGVAIVRWVNGRVRLEYPIGKVLYETSGYISHPRFSPKGDLIAFMDHQLEHDNRGWIAVVDLSGKKTVLSGEWSGEEGLAWSTTGNEVWFTANKSGEADALYAVTLAGKERLVLRVPDGLMLQDIFRDGRVLISQDDSSTTIVAELSGETKGRDLSSMESGFLSDLSADGTMILIGYEGEGAGLNYAVYARKTDGSPAVRLGDGAGGKLSPDGKWALTVLLTPPQLMMLPVGAGEPRSLPRGPIEEYAYPANWFPDGKQVVFRGREPGHDWCYYVQSIDGGPPRAITPEGTTAPSWNGTFVSPDGQWIIAADAQRQLSFYPVEVGTPQPIQNLKSEDEIIGWSSDGRSLYLTRNKEMPLQVYRFDLKTGRRDLLKEIMPADVAAIHSEKTILMTPDGKGCAYSINRMFSELYMVEGLK